MAYTTFTYRQQLLHQSILSEVIEEEDNISNFEAGFQAILNEGVATGSILPTIADQRLLNDIYITADAQGLFTGDFFYHFENTGDFSFQSINWCDPTGQKALSVGTGNLVGASGGMTTDDIN